MLSSLSSTTHNPRNIDKNEQSGIIEVQGKRRKRVKKPALEDLVEQLCENPYYQYFIGMHGYDFTVKNRHRKGNFFI